MRDLQDRLKLVAVLFIAAFAPYAVAQGYVPTPYGVMGRTCLLAALCYGALLAGMFVMLEKLIGYILLAVILVSFAFANNSASRAYANVFYRENQVLNEAQDALRAKRNLRRFEITPVAVRFGRNNYAEGFTAQWDFNSALHLATGRKDLTGVVVFK